MSKTRSTKPGKNPAAGNQASRAVQYFTDEQLQRSSALSVTERLRFLDQYRQLHGNRHAASKSKLISLKVPEALLDAFRRRCELDNTKYQTQIKQLMQDYLAK